MILFSNLIIVVPHRVSNHPCIYTCKVRELQFICCLSCVHVAMVSMEAVRKLMEHPQEQTTVTLAVFVRQQLETLDQTIAGTRNRNHAMDTNSSKSPVNLKGGENVDGEVCWRLRR